MQACDGGVERLALFGLSLDKRAEAAALFGERRHVLGVALVGGEGRRRRVAAHAGVAIGRSMRVCVAPAAGAPGNPAASGRPGENRVRKGAKRPKPGRSIWQTGEAGMAREFDEAAFKRWFDHKRMVEDLLRGFAPATVARTLDFTTLEQLPADYVDDGLARGQGDAAWRVRFRGAADEWLYLLVLLEFQSTVDRRMAARILAYTARMYLKLIRGGDLPPDGRLPPVLPVVIYNGERRWSAATEMGETIAAVGEALAPFQPRQRHLVIDEHAFRIEDLPEENVVSAQIALEQGSVPAMAAVLRRVSALLSGAEHASLRRAFAELTLGMVERSAAARTHPELASALRAAAETGGLNAMGSVLARRIDEYIETNAEARAQELAEARAQELAEARAQELAEGRAEELAEARAQELAEARAEERVEAILEERLVEARAMLSRQAERKFGAGTGARLAALLAEIADPKRLAAVGDLVIDCADGAELLARVREEANRR